MAEQSNMINPLDTGETVYLSMMNPNPTSSKTAKGPIYRVSFELEQDMWQLFMDANTAGLVLACALQPVPDTSSQKQEPHIPKPKKGPYGDFAHWLYQSSFFRTRDVWDKIGGQASHKEFIQHQKCVICGDFDYLDGTGLCEEAHVRSSHDAGTAFKPPYISVPMCHDDHATQHNPGYSALIDDYMRNSTNNTNMPDLSVSASEIEEGAWLADELRSKAMRMIEIWCKTRIYEIFSIDSLTHLSPDALAEFCESKDIHFVIPDKFRKKNKE